MKNKNTVPPCAPASAPDGGAGTGQRIWILMGEFRFDGVEGRKVHASKFWYPTREAADADIEPFKSWARESVPAKMFGVDENSWKVQILELESALHSLAPEPQRNDGSQGQECKKP